MPISRVFIAAMFTLALVAPAASQGLRVSRADAREVVRLFVDEAVLVEVDRPFAEVQIAQPEIADVEPLSDRGLYLLGRARGRTSLTLVDAAGEVIESAVVLVEPNLDALKALMAEVLPEEAVEVRPARDGVVLSGSMSGPAAVQRAVSLAQAFTGGEVTNLTTVGSRQQVSLRVRIAEMNRSKAKELGISTGAARVGDPRIGARSGRSFPITGGAAPGFAPTGPTGFGSIDAIFSVADSLLLNISIDALEQKGFARMLAEPNLVALSGSEADFLAGGEVPIPVPGNDGEVTIDFKRVGVSLTFRPTVLDDEAISVAVSAEVASLDPTLGATTGALEIPGFSVRRATTVIELEDGESFAIAGLYEDNYSDTVSQVPVLGDVPVLGALFRSADYQRGESELVVIVSADLIAPVKTALDRLATPLDRVSIPNEAELFLLGRTVRDAQAPVPPFDGPFGYVLD